jgi:hypothetical protein
VWWRDGGCSTAAPQTQMPRCRHCTGHTCQLQCMRNGARPGAGSAGPLVISRAHADSPSSAAVWNAQGAEAVAAFSLRVPAPVPAVCSLRPDAGPVVLSNAATPRAGRSAESAKTRAAPWAAAMGAHPGCTVQQSTPWVDRTSAGHGVSRCELQVLATPAAHVPPVGCSAD